ncbi:ORF6N domain-containing protein [Bacillus paranthracis]|uniref:hypothetical protein n=1 Tax=Bacillus paranthracis TaxID=2026186 RepID=UPI00187A7F22|nr:hypothetical protein [Bacillus paranthracis]MBE7117323.1 ORF6N domain-containing protein [Bacillus paranthracis]MBE7134936.1 ORF6N domain-containing protein [Bacillus paranthracis]MBE7156345.1 ORF6N domain-containing protein [Bacillus paranthracis]
MATIIKNEETFILDANIRESHMNRIEVLEKVKGLLLLPNLEMATTKQVAEFYEVKEDVIRQLVLHHGDEFISDGYNTVTGREARMLLSEKSSLNKIISKRGCFLVETDNGFVKMANRGNALFPRRAILRVGMLLRDSVIAKEVRTQLLNIEEKTTQEVKVADINEEQTLQMAVGQAFMSGDINALAQAATGLMAFKNRHIAEIETKLGETETVVKALAKEETSFKNPKQLIKKLADRYAKAHGGKYYLPWKDLTHHLYYKTSPSIRIEARKTRSQRTLGSKKKISLLDVVQDHEFPTVIAAMVALCENKGIDVKDIMKEVAK